ncbi:MAG: hypothetical protein FWC14_08400 [Candidatus Bathyarchaeota archaeon]|uniref:hypothetical protein n=1 Tax=Candidatus Bathycorpusculum sp. TaxID=2994959 RepID=UPI00281F6AF6|nr:hypothetical protein [Candidatus Termiticorpusculum sp.]
MSDAEKDKMDKLFQLKMLEAENKQNLYTLLLSTLVSICVSFIIVHITSNA